ncbi:type 2 periplasmic-binding domain-containing protein [Enterovibrio calviensis]|uniref:ABC transporter substrate-binding protein n=1 Tax=Enterovibrio calviensis TaxID=91359 RepID=UPI00054D390F|nr:ABC transporter substrate-binding protein [Enterovibrio calviensis]
MSKKSPWISRAYLLPLCCSTGLIISSPTVADTLDYYVVQDQSEPLQIQDEGQNHRGIITDVLVKALEGSDHELAIHTYPFNRMVLQLTDNQDKNWITYGSPQWGGMQSANLSSSPLFEVKHSIVSNTNDGLPYQLPHDLNGKIAVLLFGFDYPGLDAKIKKGEVSEVRVKNYDAAFRVVDRLKNTGGFVEMDIRLKYHLKRLGFTDQDYQLHQVSNLIPNYNIHLAYSPNIDPEIKQYIDQRLLQMNENNEINSIINKYL